MPEESKADQAFADPVLDVWTIIAYSPGGQDLLECHIQEVSRGHYKFTNREGNTLAESTIFPPIFEDVELGDQKFTISVGTNLSEDPEFAFGEWRLHDASDAGGNGQWTAQAGGDPKATKAASADAY